MNDDEEFEQLFLHARRRLVGQLYVVTGDLGEAQDMVQEAFVRAWLRWSKLASYEDPEAWVRRVAMNLAANRWRSLRRRRRETMPALTPSAADSADDSITRLHLTAALRDVPGASSATPWSSITSSGWP